MPLELLQHALRIQTRVRIVEAGYKSERHNVVRTTVNPRAAVFLRSQRPAHGVNNFSRTDPASRDFPEFLDSLTVRLRVAVASERETVDQLLSERTARAFSENDNLGLQIVTGLEVRFRVVLLVDALIVRADAGNTIAIEQQLGAGEAGEDRYSSLLDFAPQPFHKAIQRNDIIAVISQRRRRDGKFDFAFFGKKVDCFFAHFSIERRFFFKAGKQFMHGARFEQRAGEAVLADVARFLKNVDVLFTELRVRTLCVVPINKLRKPQCAGHAGRPTANDDDVGRHLRTVDSLQWRPKNQHTRKAADSHRLSRIIIDDPCGSVADSTLL